MASTHHDHALEDLNDTQRRVHRILAAASNPLSAYEVLDKMRGKGAVTPPTVYRCLDKLIRKGLAHRLESLNAYVACRSSEAGHAAGFLICDCCGATQEFEAEVGGAVERAASAKGYALGSVTLEAHGRCRACR